MKIIVMDSANVRIEVLNVPDHMIKRTSSSSWLCMSIRSITFHG